jgi:hypothetical protein
MGKSLVRAFEVPLNVFFVERVIEVPAIHALGNVEILTEGYIHA